jgi:hypothetical protein
MYIEKIYVAKKAPLLLLLMGKKAHQISKCPIEKAVNGPEFPIPIHSLGLSLSFFG